MTTKKKSSKAKSKTTAKKTITDKKLGEILTETLNQVAEETAVEPIIEAPVENVPATETSTEPVKQSKLARMVELLQAPQGIPLKKLAKKLCWLENSVRGAMSVYAKKHPEFTLVTEKSQGVRTYRLEKKVD